MNEQMYELFAVLDDRKGIFGDENKVVPLGFTVPEDRCEAFVKTLVANGSLPEEAMKVWAHPTGQSFDPLTSEGFGITI